jgi:hypothetical protein
MLNKCKNFIRSLSSSITTMKNQYTFEANYKVIEICKTENDDYTITIQVINKNIVMQVKPEEILAKDHLVDQFSPRDIRTLTYLGYLGINSPKYQILAKRLSTKNDDVIFALKKKGEKKIIAKSAKEIMNEKEIIENLPASDANIVGYTVASENIFAETKMKAKLKEEINYEQQELIK